MLKRIRTWQSALDTVIRERMHRPFGWGSQDCCIFAADCVLAITGEDLAADLRGSYSDMNGAAALLDRLGGVAAIAAARLGAEVVVLAAQTGDVAMLRFEGRDTLAICVGSRLFAPGPAGLVGLPMSEALRVWRCTKS